MRTTEEIAAGPDAEALGADLVQRAQAGDLNAFEDLVRPRLAHLLRTATVVLGNEADAADATQDVFIAAWQKLPSLRDPARLDAWLGRILLNTCRMRLRDRRRVREITVSDFSLLHETAGSATVEVAAVEMVGRAFERLSADDRMLLALHYVHHEPLRRLADEMGSPIGTIKWRLFRARRALARAVEAEQ